MASTDTTRQRAGHEETTPKVKVIVTEDHVAVLNPPVTEVMLLLTPTVRTFVPDDGPTGYRCVEESVPLGELDHKGRMVFSAGLLPRVLALFDRVGLASGRVRRRGSSLMVATFGSVPRDTAGRWDVLLLPYGGDSTGNRAFETIVRMDFPRIYACVPRNPPSDRLVRLRLEQVAGPVIGALEKPEARVNVVVVPATTGAFVKTETALGRKRTLYWQNPARNGTVADVARAVVNGDWKALRRHGVQRRFVPETTTGRTPRVAVLVESTEHGRELQTPLPGWALCATTSNEVGEKVGPGATGRGMTSAVGIGKAASGPGEGDATSTAQTDETNTKKRARASRAELDAKRTIKTDWKESVGVAWGEIQTATTDTRGEKKSQAGVDTITADDATGPVIVTATYAASRGVDVDVLVRATGTDSPLRVKGFPAPRDDEGYEALLIDFEDSGHLDVAEDARRRLHDYERRGMTIIAAHAPDQNNEASERNPSGAGLTGPSGVGPVEKPAQQSGLKPPTPSRSPWGRN